MLLSFGVLRASEHLLQSNKICLSASERKFEMWRERCVRQTCVASLYTRGTVGARVATAVTFALVTLSAHLACIGRINRDIYTTTLM